MNPDCKSQRSVWLCRWLPVAVWWLVWLLAVAHLVSGAWSWDVGLHKFANALQPVRPVEGPGLSQRVFLDNDPYYWISYAREMAATGQWRIRYTYIDNVPFGRQVHWSQSVSWLLLGFGFVRHLFFAEPMRVAIEAAAIWLNPVLLAVGLALGGVVLARRLGVAAAALFMLTVATLPDVQWAFHPFRPDHQTLHLMFGFGTTLALILGGLGWVQAGSDSAQHRGWRWFQPWELPVERAARRYFVVAGVLTGLGLWTGATVQFFSVAAVTAGSVFIALFMPPAGGATAAVAYRPNLWRWWGWTGAVVSLAMYAVEYFPNHLAMRLEVNHPLYALTLVAVAELMVTLTRARLPSEAVRSNWLRAGIWTMGVLAVPLLVWLGPPQWHHMRDPQMKRVHEFILEFYSLSRFLGSNVMDNWWRGYGLLPAAIIAALFLAGPKRTRVHEWAGLWMSFLLCLFFLFLTFWQVRWAAFYGLANVWLAVVVGHVIWRNVLSTPLRSHSRRLAGIATLVIAAQALVFGCLQQSSQMRLQRGEVFESGLVDVVMKKHLAEGLGAHNKNGTMRVLCEPDLAGALYYFGGISSVSSFYWENLDGLHDAIRFFAATDDQEALAVAKRRGLTHVLVPNDANLPVIFNYVRTASRRVEDAQPTLLYRLYRRNSNIPTWLRVDPQLDSIGRRNFAYRSGTLQRALESRITIYQLRLGDEADQQPQHP